MDSQLPFCFQIGMMKICNTGSLLMTHYNPDPLTHAQRTHTMRKAQSLKVKGGYNDVQGNCKKSVCGTFELLVW